MFAVCSIAIAGTTTYHAIEYAFDENGPLTEVDPDTGVITPLNETTSSVENPTDVDYNVLIISYMYYVDGEPFSQTVTVRIFGSDGSYQHYSETHFF
ncbi:MAG: hypothetical protein F4039_04675 [Gammaproteobacteria bacterium]|nr:hypothetical protein [Gammaproteobacteria bacterium]MYK43366.1 hypothetical protein [Gammaproteobacteria bacterium]